MLIFHREPALILATIAATVALASSFVFHLSPDQVGAINTVAFFVVGLITAWSVDKNGLAAAIMGVIGAVLALGVSFGAHLSSGDQSVLMSFAAAVVAMFVRTQVSIRPEAVA